MKKINIPILIFSFFLSLSINLKIEIIKSLDIFINKFNINILFIIKTIILGLIIYLLLFFLFKFVDKIPLKKDKFQLDKKRLIIIFISIFMTTFIYLLTHYPAVYLNDTIFMIYYPFGRGSPVLYGIVMSVIFFSIKYFLSSSITVFIMSIIQSIISSLILTYVIYVFNKKVKNKVLTIILSCYYIFVPIISNYNMTLNKDTPFSLLMILFVLLIWDIVDTKGKILSNGKFIFKLIVISILIISVRNNGLFIVLLSLLLIFIKYGFKNYKLKFSVVLFSIIISSLIPLLFLKMKNEDFPKRELYTIPIQQVSYVVKYKSDSLSKNDYLLLSRFIKNPNKTISENYNPYCVDFIKFNENFSDDAFNENYKDFLKLWIKLAPNNISAYTKSYLLSTYDLWSINKLEKAQSVFWKASTSFVDYDKRIYNKVIINKSVNNIFIKFYDIFNTYLNPAGCFILLMVTLLYSNLKKRKKALIISFPLILLWLILMLGTPLSSALRYMAPYIYILPIIMLFTFKETRGE